MGSGLGTLDRQEEYISFIKKRLEQSERLLTVKQLQINSLLDLTHAINNNFDDVALFRIYEIIMRVQLGITKIALYVKDQNWRRVISIGTQDGGEHIDVERDLTGIRRFMYIDPDQHTALAEFGLVIPVIYKQRTIAYALTDAIQAEAADPLEEKVKFIQTITAMVNVAIENKKHIQREIEQHMIEKEMELAGQMQNMLIPGSLPNDEQLEMAAIYQPHRDIGGDYYDYIQVDEKRVALCMADISGKGVAAGLLMANFQANLRALVKNELTLEMLVRELNTKVSDIMKGQKFITMFIGMYHLESRELTFVNAGHNPSILINGGQAEELTDGCTILGMFDDLPSLRTGKVVLQPGAVLINYTDGLTELENPGGEMFETVRLTEFIQANRELSMEEFNKKLLLRIDDYRVDVPFSDDVSVLSCRFK